MNAIALFASMINSLLPLFLFLYLFFKQSWSQCPFVNYFVLYFQRLSSFPEVYQLHFEVFIHFLRGSSLKKMKNILFFFYVIQILLIISGTVEINPGPHVSKNLSFAIWNLDSLPARDFARIPFIESLQTTYDVDIFGVCESMLTENISNEDILMNGFSPDPFRSDKDPDTRNGGVCMYFKEYLLINEGCDLEILPETIVAEIKLERKKVFIVLSYRHPNMSNEELVEYMSLLENIYKHIRKENPTVSILCGDFNARSPLFWEGDSENHEGRLFNNLLMSNHLEQLIDEPTHVHDDVSQSCIDSIFTNQPFTFMETGFCHP